MRPGVNAASRPDWGDRNTSADLFHDPLVCFAFLAGATHLTLTNTFARRHHKRIAGRSRADHLAATRRFRDAVTDVR